MDPAQWISTMNNPEFREPPAPLTIQKIDSLLLDLVKENEDYAWTWYCAFKLAITDSDGSDRVATNSAVHLMKQLFDVRIKLNPHWKE